MTNESSGAGPPPATRPTGERLRQRRINRRWYAVGGAVGVAVLGATATAIITPERIDAIFGGSTSVPSPTASPSPIPYDIVSTSSGAITVDVPDDWGARDSVWNVTEDRGDALRTGKQFESEIAFHVDGAYLGASKAARSLAGATDLDESGRRTLLRSFIEADWSVEGCSTRPDPVWEKPGWLVEATRWEDCASLEGARLFEFAALDRDAEVLVVSQMVLVAGTPDEVVERYVQSFAVDPSKLPGQSTGDLILP
jgi:hypothetical protein